jgi:hypothetical protein
MLCDCGELSSTKCKYKLCGKCCQDPYCTKHYSKSKKKSINNINNSILKSLHDEIYDLIPTLPDVLVVIIMDYLDYYDKCTTCHKLFEHYSSYHTKCKICVMPNMRMILDNCDSKFDIIKGCFTLVPSIKYRYLYSIIYK